MIFVEGEMALVKAELKKNANLISDVSVQIK